MQKSDIIDNFFVCLGAQKSGTTWLARMLAGHPDLFLTPVKELHYFDHLAGITQHLSDKKRHSRYRKYHQRLWTQPRRFATHKAQWRWYKDYMDDPIDDDWYRSLFRQRAGRTFAGEVTPEYAIIGKTGYQHLRRLAPDVRLLFIMRNPVAQAWSQLLHHCRSNGIDAAGLSTGEITTLLQQPRFAEISDYDTTLRNLGEVFTQEQLLTLFYEDMHEGRARALRRVCEFIGIGFDAAWFPEPEQRYNKSQSAAMPEPVRHYLRATHRPLAMAIEARLGTIPQSWRDEFGGP